MKPRRENTADETTRLFELCDSGKKGYLTKEDLHRACPQLSEDEIAFIFSCLDTNNSGSIDKAEFCAGFEETLCKGASKGFCGMQRKISTTESGHYYYGETDTDIAAGAGEETAGGGEEHHSSSNDASGGGGFGGFNLPPRSPGARTIGGHQPFDHHYHQQQALPVAGPRRHSHVSVQKQISLDIPCKDEVLQLYEELQGSGIPQLMDRFEEVVGNLCREIGAKRDENERLKLQQRAERESYTNRMTSLENEIDQQLLLAEAKAREEERQRLSREKEELKERLEEEKAQLQANIENLQRMEKLLKKEAQRNGNQDSLKDKLDEIAKENRQLKNNLADNHLEMTLIKSELAELRSEYENKALADEALGGVADFGAQSTADAENMHRQLQLLYDANCRLHDTNENLRGALEHRTVAIHQMNMLQQHGAAFGGGASGGSRGYRHSIPGGGGGTLFDPASSGGGSPTAAGGTNCPTTDDDNDSGLPPFPSFGSHHRMGNGNGGSSPRPPSSSDISSLEYFRCASLDQHSVHKSSMAGNGGIMLFRPQHYINPEKMCLTEFTGPPDRTFRVVMCGDASVGKSSIIMRIIRGAFQSNISSTLGVDFHVKMVRVGIQNVAIQLWDTAGQERFRSLCNSYFRRADGAILVYDCSVDRSFLRIRDWIETVKESTMKEVPILLVSNKIDLRDSEEGQKQSAKFVSQKEGENLAQLLETDFIEVSARDGTNVETALLLLVSEMMKVEDSEMKNAALILQQQNNGGGQGAKKKGCFGCRSS